MRIAIVDGDNHAYKFYHATQGKAPMIPGLMSIMTRVFREYTPDIMFVAWEGKFSFRAKLVDDYKADRGKLPHKVYLQYLKARSIMRHFGIIQATAHGYEADDVIVTLAERCCWDGDDIEIFVISEDKDLYQCLTNPCVKMESTFSKVGKSCNGLIDYSGFINFFGFPPEYFVLYQFLVGDKSDNIAGIPNIGPKKATNIIKQFVEENVAPDIELLVRENKLPIPEDFDYMTLWRMVKMCDDAPIKLVSDIKESVVKRIVRDENELSHLGRAFGLYRKKVEIHKPFLESIQSV